MSQRPPAKPEAWGRWSGPRPPSPAGDNSTPLDNSKVIFSRSIVRQFRWHHTVVPSLCFTAAPAHRFTIPQPSHSRFVKIPKPRFPELSNFGSPPAEPEDFLWINRMPNRCVGRHRRAEKFGPPLSEIRADLSAGTFAQSRLVHRGVSE